MTGKKKRLNDRQKKFLEIKMKNPGISNYQAAIKANYSPNYAKNITQKMVETGGIKEFLDMVLSDDTLAQLINEGALAVKKDTFSGKVTPDYRTRHLYISDLLELKGLKQDIPPVQVTVLADIVKEVGIVEDGSKTEGVAGKENPE